MDWTNLIIQLGISGLIVFAGFKISMKLIDHWARGDAERTKNIGEGFVAITSRHEMVMQTINEHQASELQVLNGLAMAIQRVESRVDTVLDLTPIRGIRQLQPQPLPEEKLPDLPQHKHPTPPPGSKRAATNPRLPSSSEYSETLKRKP
jgi:hypothetical protein